jgi:hypothetical protein
VKTRELAFLEGKNELVFECKKPKSKLRKWPKTHPFCSIELEKRLKHVFGSSWEDS